MSVVDRYCQRRAYPVYVVAKQLPTSSPRWGAGRIEVAYASFSKARATKWFQGGNQASSTHPKQLGYRVYRWPHKMTIDELEDAKLAMKYDGGWLPSKDSKY